MGRNKIGGLVGASKALAVDLTAESSSVTSLPAARKGNHNSGLKVGSPRSNRVAVRHGVPLDQVLHHHSRGGTSNRNPDSHSILINNRLILAASNTASTASKSSPSSSGTTTSSSKQAQAIRKTVFYNPDEDDETQVSAV